MCDLSFNCFNLTNENTVLRNNKNLFFYKKILMKWGEYASEVQLILKRSTPETNKVPGPSTTRLVHGSRPCGLPSSTADQLISKNLYEDAKHIPNISAHDFDDVQDGLERNRDIRKSLTFSGLHGSTSENASEVKSLLCLNYLYLFANLLDFTFILNCNFFTGSNGEYCHNSTYTAIKI